MKKIIISLWAAVAALAAVSCTPEVISGLDGGAVPKASELDVTVSVDQTTNYVTFTLNNPGMTPMWMFSETEIVTNNNFQRRYRNAGTYTIEVKAFNRNGISDAPLTKEFTVDNDYVVPSHPLYGTGSKRWKIAASVDDHLALGPSIEDVSWYGAAAYEKASTGFYDDRITFTQNGGYTYDPGPDGLIFVNSAVTSLNTEGKTEDFDAAAQMQETTYTLSDDEGLLTLPANTFLPYLAHQVQLDGEWTYTVKTLSDDRLILGWFITEQNMGWQIILEPADVVERNPLWGAGSKVWKIAKEEYGHLALGPNIDDVSWYGAIANEKSSTGFYDDRVTFTEEGGYIYDPGPDGLIFVNSAVSSLNTEGKTEDFDAPVERQEATYSVNDDETALTLPAGTLLPYLAHQVQLDGAWEYKIKELTSSKLILGWFINEQNMGWQIILEPADAPAPPPPFTPGAQLEPAEYGDMLAGSWTWESSSQGHIGCGPSLADPVSWWNGAPDVKEQGSVYDDVITFGAGNSFEFDPVDGKTYMNKGVTAFTGVKVDIPYEDAPGEGDWRIEAAVQESTYTYTASGEFPSITLPAGIYFSYIPDDAVFNGTIVYYITAMWENQIEISAAWPDSGIAWRYRLKRVS